MRDPSHGRNSRELRRNARWHFLVCWIQHRGTTMRGRPNMCRTGEASRRSVTPHGYVEQEATSSASGHSRGLRRGGRIDAGSRGGACTNRGVNLACSLRMRGARHRRPGHPIRASLRQHGGHLAPPAERLRPRPGPQDDLRDQADRTGGLKALTIRTSGPRPLASHVRLP